MYCKYPIPERFSTLGEIIKGLTCWTKANYYFIYYFHTSSPPPYIHEKKQLSIWTTSAELAPLRNLVIGQIVMTTALLAIAKRIGIIQRKHKNIYP